MQKRNLLFWIGLLAFFTQTLSADGEEGQAGAFLRYGIGGRTLGMGRTYAASIEDANSTGLNPAGLVGSKRLEITSMYSNLFYDSRYAHVGIVVPRPFEATKLGILRYLVGPNTAFGLCWIGLGMVGFEQRSSSGERVGEFGLNEDALLLAWAREETGSWGLLRYGLAFKGVHQGYPGLSDASEQDLSNISRSWSWGMDAGLSFQPIHAPVLNVVSLRYLVPLRLGFVVKNVVRPSWKTASAEDRFPRTFRTGLSYRWILKDWIPVSWTAVRYVTGNVQLLTAFDWEWMQDYSNRTVYQGSFFGIEGFIPLSENAICVCPRFGFHDKKDGPSVGIGVLLPFSKLAFLQMDYAYGFHPYLPNDSRFFLTLRMGPDKGVGYFKRQAQKSVEQGRSEREWLLKTIATYPETDAHLAARSLAAMENDSAHIRRYYNLIGGIDLANCLFVDAKNLLRQDKTKEAQQKASDAVREYNALYNQREENPLSDTDITNYGETLILAGRSEDAVRILEEVSQPSLRSHYLSGVGEHLLGHWDKAMANFTSTVNFGAEDARQRMSEAALNPRSMVSLSYLGIAEALLRKGDFNGASNWLDRLIQEFPDSLDSDYPRYPTFRDRNIVDDAQFLKGLCRIALKDYREGLVSLLETQRYYLQFQYGDMVKSNTPILLDFLEKEDWAALAAFIENWFMQYWASH